MPWVAFAPADGLRLALAAGAIPAAVASRPVAMRIEGDRVTVAADDVPNLDAVRRLGGRIVATCDGATDVPNWFVGVPLVPDDVPRTAPSSIRLIDARAASAIVAWPVERVAIVGERLAVHLRGPASDDATAFRHARPGHWVRVGFRHRLESLLPCPAAGELLWDKSGVVAIDEWHPWQIGTGAVLDLPHRDPELPELRSALAIAVPLRIGPPTSPRLFCIDDRDAFAGWLAAIGPRSREAIRLATVRHGSRRMEIAASPRVRVPFAMPLAEAGDLRPAVRIAGIDEPGLRTWLEADGSTHRIADAAFRTATVRCEIPAVDFHVDAIADSLTWSAWSTHAPPIEELAAPVERGAMPARESRTKSIVSRMVDSWKSKPKPIDLDEPPEAAGPSIVLPDRPPLELERTLFDQLTTLASDRRARLWAELAEAYTQRRAQADASLAWLNAAWDGHPPPATWLAIEADPARQRAIASLAGNGRVDSGPDWPIRLAWLAAVARRDPLHLAYVADDLRGELTHGLSPDRDAPAFVRRLGAGEEFAAVRDWLVRIRQAAAGWVATSLAGRGRLQRVGLDPDVRTTAAHANLFAAEAARRLGERTLADRWRREAIDDLDREPDDRQPLHRRLAERSPEPAEATAFERHVARTYRAIAADVWSPTHFPATDASAESTTLDDLVRTATAGNLGAITQAKTDRPEWLAPLARTLMSAPQHAADARTATAAAAWLAGGRVDRGLSLLDACREQLYSPHRLAPRDHTRLAVVAVRALAFAPPRIARGRLEELFQRLDGLDPTGSVNRYFSPAGLAVCRAAFAAGVPTTFDVGDRVRAWLAEDERIVLARIAVDLAGNGVVR